MTDLKLNQRQAALILEVSEEGEVKVEVAANQTNGREGEFAASICQVIASKLVNDEHFQEEIFSIIYDGEKEEEENDH